LRPVLDNAFSRNPVFSARKTPWGAPLILWPYWAPPRPLFNPLLKAGVLGVPLPPLMVIGFFLSRGAWSQVSFLPLDSFGRGGFPKSPLNYRPPLVTLCCFFFHLPVFFYFLFLFGHSLTLGAVGLSPQVPPPLKPVVFPGIPPPTVFSKTSFGSTPVPVPTCDLQGKLCFPPHLRALPLTLSFFFFFRLHLHPHHIVFAP